MRDLTSNGRCFLLTRRGVFCYSYRHLKAWTRARADRYRSCSTYTTAVLLTEAKGRTDAPAWFRFRLSAFLVSESPEFSPPNGAWRGSHSDVGELRHYGEAELSEMRVSTRHWGTPKRGGPTTARARAPVIATENQTHQHHGESRGRPVGSE